MPVRKMPDPELLPVHRPRCPQCQARMITIDIASGHEGFECRTFECRKCGHAETDIVACDPFESMQRAGSTNRRASSYNVVR
jgi:tRNA(Ile2) C34 agmatinyltransferase TiaS